jgi:hypothetical protein
VQDLEENRKNNLTYQAQTDDLLRRYARKTAKNRLSFASSEFSPCRDLRIEKKRMGAIFFLATMRFFDLNNMDFSLMENSLKGIFL